MITWFNWFMTWLIVGLIYFGYLDAQKLEKQRQLRQLSEDIINKFTTEESPTLTEMVDYHKENEPIKYKLD